MATLPESRPSLPFKASFEKSGRLKPVPLLRKMFTPFETKRKEKIPSYPIKSIQDTGSDWISLYPDEQFPERHFQNLKATLFEAYSTANSAVQLDHLQDIRGAHSAYLATCKLLHLLELRVSGESKEIESVRRRYMTRARELRSMLPLMEESDNELRRRQESTQAAPHLKTNSQSPSILPEDVFGNSPYQEPMNPGWPVSDGNSPVSDQADAMMSLEFDSFAGLINSAINKPTAPETPFTQLPEDLQIDIEFHDKGQDLSTWTCTPSAQFLPEKIPLRVDGHPVVLPVEYKYPLIGMFSPPPDPHPRFISPSAPLSDEEIHDVISTFSACIGFYLLINGSLQVIMPDGFDYEEGVPSLPSEYGGLKVSLIPEAVCPTAGEASASSPSSTKTSTRTPLERIFGQSSSPSAVAGPARTSGAAGVHPANGTGISVGCAIRAMVPRSKSKQRFEGKTGIVVSPHDDGSRKYITIPIHLLTDAVRASRTTSLDLGTWKDDVKVCVASNLAELGKVTAVFDEEPRSFPVGFSHDVSLVDISGVSDIPRTIPYATDLSWLSQQEWMDIKYNSSNLVLLDDRSREAKSIGIVDSRCQMVGQGIFRIQQQSRKRSSFLGSLSAGSSSSRPQDPRDDPSTWTSLVARSILYRVHPDYPVRGGQSGVPVCVVSESRDGTASRSTKVAGFASFVQMVSDVQKYDLEGDKLYKRLQEGRVAFYGAFQVPQELREGYQIL